MIWLTLQSIDFRIAFDAVTSLIEDFALLLHNIILLYYYYTVHNILQDTLLLPRCLYDPLFLSLTHTHIFVFLKRAYIFYWNIQLKTVNNTYIVLNNVQKILLTIESSKTQETILLWNSSKTISISKHKIYFSPPLA